MARLSVNVKVIAALFVGMILSGALAVDAEAASPVLTVLAQKKKKKPTVPVPVPKPPAKLKKEPKH